MRQLDGSPLWQRQGNTKMKSRQLAVLIFASLVVVTQAVNVKAPRQPWTGVTMVAFSGEPSRAPTSIYPRQ
jgi:hypothetical protein